MKRVILTMLVAGLLTACAGDFSPTVDESGGTTTEMTTDGSTGDGTGGTDDGEGSTGEGTDDGSTGPELDMGGADTGEPPEMPGPDEPCDPMLAADGIAPCHDPEVPNKIYTCAPIQLMPDPGSLVVEFRCLPVDDEGNGYDIGSPCSDAGVLLNGGAQNGCENAFCLWNGLATNPQFDEYQNHPANACPFQPDGPDGPLVKGCCSPYCDDAHACDQGWQCEPISSNGLQEPVDYPDVGTCVWVGG